LQLSLKPVLFSTSLPHPLLRDGREREREQSRAEQQPIDLEMIRVKEKCRNPFTLEIGGGDFLSRKGINLILIDGGP
jgi:hypothetical protein